MPKIVDHEARRAEISRIILRIVAKHGLDRITMRSLARESGFSSGAIAHYFANKNSMLTFAVTELATSVYNRIDEKLSGCSSALEKLRVILEEHLPGGTDQSMAIISLAFWGSAARDKAMANRFREIYRRWRAYITLCLEEGIDSNEISLQAGIAEEVDLIVAMTDGLLVSIGLDAERFSKARCNRLYDLVLSRLQAPSQVSVYMTPSISTTGASHCR